LPGFLLRARVYGSILLHALTNSFLAATSLTREPFAGKVAAMMVAMFCGGAVSPVVKNIYMYIYTRS
jgi:hypothetical protein